MSSCWWHGKGIVVPSPIITSSFSSLPSYPETSVSRRGAASPLTSLTRARESSRAFRQAVLGLPNLAAEIQYPEPLVAPAGVLYLHTWHVGPSLFRYDISKWAKGGRQSVSLTSRCLGACCAGGRSGCITSEARPLRHGIAEHVHLAARLPAAVYTFHRQQPRAERPPLLRAVTWVPDSDDRGI